MSLYDSELYPIAGDGAFLGFRFCNRFSLDLKNIYIHALFE